MLKNQTKKTIKGKIISVIGWLVVISIAYFSMVFNSIGQSKKQPEYTKSFIDSVIKKNEKIGWLEKDSAFIQWSNPAIRYAFRKWLKLNPNKKDWK